MISTGHLRYARMRRSAAAGKAARASTISRGTSSGVGSQQRQPLAVTIDDAASAGAEEIDEADDVSEADDEAVANIEVDPDIGVTPIEGL